MTPVLQTLIEDHVRSAVSIEAADRLAGKLLGGGLEDGWHWALAVGSRPTN
jgi:hypothetical protein